MFVRLYITPQVRSQSTFVAVAFVYCKAEEIERRGHNISKPHGYR